MPPEGLEPGAVFPKETRSSGAGGSKSGNNTSQTGTTAPSDPDLKAVISAWPRLSDTVRAAVVALVRTLPEGGQCGVSDEGPVPNRVDGKESR